MYRTKYRALTPGAWDWQLGAGCRGMDSSVFFPPDGERGKKRADREAKAAAVCAGCRVRQTCAEFAGTRAEPYGVWGGQTSAARSAVR